MEMGFKEKVTSQVVSLVLNYVSMFRKLILVRAIIRIDQTVRPKVCNHQNLPTEMNGHDLV